MFRACLRGSLSDTCNEKRKNNAGCIVSGAVILNTSTKIFCDEQYGYERGERGNFASTKEAAEKHGE